MQFFPFPYSVSGASALGGISRSVNEAFSATVASGNEFLNKFNDQLAALGVSPVVAESGTPAGFRTATLDKKSLQSEDLEVLRASLKKRGFKDEQLNTLETLINSGQPLTMGSLVNALEGRKRVSAALTEEERGRLDSALGKMGFSKDESAALEEMMDQGKAGPVVQAVNRKLRDMERDVRLSLDKAEIQSLARGLELSDKTSQKMLALFGSKEELSLNQQELSALLAPAGKEVAEKGQALRKMAGELRGAIDDTLKSARFRESTADDVDARTSRKAERSETRINDTLTAKSNSLGPEALAERLRRLTPTEDDGAPEQEADQEQAGTDQAHKAFAARKSENGNPAAAREEEARAPRVESGPALANLTAEGVFSSGSESSSGVPARPENLNASARQELFSQVEQGMLRELTDGSRQITLRLDPEELGRINVLLTVRQGEVRAVIRTDNEETTSALSQQMVQLKTSLEEQGLKVTQLEVETRMADNSSSQHWGGAAQYNQEQELREQARFLQLAKIRQEAGNDLARNMQFTSVNSAVQEEISGLHIVA